MDDRFDTDFLTELIGKKLAVLQQLRDLSRRQTDLITDGNTSRLLSVLAAKQTLLAELQKIQKRLNPFRNQDPETRHWRSREDRLQCRQLSERCETLLGEIMLVERQSESELLQRRNAAVARLQGSHSATRATRAYIDSPLPTRQRLDLSSES